MGTARFILFAVFCYYLCRLPRKKTAAQAKSRMAAADYIRGRKLHVGDVLANDVSRG